MTAPTSGTTFDSVAVRAREAAYELALATRSVKDAALHAMAHALTSATPQVLSANAEDVSRARDGGVPDALVDRLRLDEGRVAAMAEGLRDVAALPDPVGEGGRGAAPPHRGEAAPGGGAF